MSVNFWLTEEQFSKIGCLFPDKPRGVPGVDDRRVLSGIIFCLQRGYCWSDVAAEYGSAKTLYNRYRRRSAAGVYERIFDALVREGSDTRILMSDASHIKTHRIAANGVKSTGHGPAIGKTKSGMNSKLHLVCDGRGQPVYLHLTAGTRPIVPRRVNALMAMCAKQRQ